VLPPARLTLLGGTSDWRDAGLPEETDCLDIGLAETELRPDVGARVVTVVEEAELR
jgi:hypothetical protein